MDEYKYFNATGMSFRAMFCCVKWPLVVSIITPRRCIWHSLLHDKQCLIEKIIFTLINTIFYFILFIQCFKRVTYLDVMASLPCGPLNI